MESERLCRRRAVNQAVHRRMYAPNLLVSKPVSDQARQVVRSAEAKAARNRSAVLAYSITDSSAHARIRLGFD